MYYAAGLQVIALMEFVPIYSWAAWRQAVIVVGPTLLGLGVCGFAAGHLIVANGWLMLPVTLLRRFRRLCADCP